MKYFLWYLCFTFSWLHAFDEFLYPVQTIIHNGQEKLCVLYQKNSTLEVWLWDPEDESAIKGLLSSFNPASLTVLPEKNGFSFIDNDHIRIKYNDKRFPKSIPLYGPYDLTTLHWIDNETFYFAAKERQHNNLFHATIEGDIFRLTVSNQNDYFCPQKIDAILFFIEKNIDNYYSIMQIEYPLEVLKKATYSLKELNKFSDQVYEDQLKTYSYHQYLDLKTAEKIFSSDKAISFLTMINQTEGFFLEHPEKINRDESTITFKYYKLFKNNNLWKTTFLFNFTVPIHLIVSKRGKNRLYESILPLLPYYDKENLTLYFVDYAAAKDVLNVFSYHCITEEKKQLTDCQFFSQSYFTPRAINQSLFCGGTLMKQIRNDLNPQIEIDEQGMQHFRFFKLN
jgi:hypothetical protein